MLVLIPVTLSLAQIFLLILDVEVLCSLTTFFFFLLGIHVSCKTANCKTFYIIILVFTSDELGMRVKWFLSNKE